MTLLAAVSVGVCSALAAAALMGTLPNFRMPRRPARGRTAAAQLWLRQAGTDLTPARFWLGSIISGLLALLVLVAVTGSLFVAAVPAVAVTLLPRTFFARRRRLRLREVQAAWPDGLHDLAASIAAGRSLTQAVNTLAEHGPEPLRVAFVRFPELARLLGTTPALEIVKDELADPTSDRVIEVLLLAHERGGAIVRAILADLVETTTRDLKLLDELETEGLEMRINARAVVVLPWLVLVALTARPGPMRDFYRSSGGVATLTVAAAMSLAGVFVLSRLGRDPIEERVLATPAEWLMTPLAVVAATAIGVGAAGFAGAMRPPSSRLAPRVRPYSVVARTALGHAPEAMPAARQDPGDAPTLSRLFGPPTRAAVAALSHLVEARRDDQLSLLLRRAGRDDITPDEFRVHQVVAALVGATVGVVAAAVLLHSPFVALVAGIAGFVVGATRARRQLERSVEERVARTRLELYTVNHLLAMHVRTGAGAMQAVQRIVDRGRGVVVSELRDVLTWTRSGMSEAAAFRRAAELTADASAARTYLMLATGIERGVDLGRGLLALSEDLRDSRREQLHKDAVRRRAAMLLPTIGILAPIMLLFIAAPLPSIVLGHR